ncbi:MAG TPA: hypothetical protein DCS23_03705 [Candidatus Yonathbacteria bacterium]|nr:hypothetical protein [Candidatus Yonathbacteria bacterium]
MQSLRLSKKKKGDVAELAVAAHCVKNGYQVLFPYGEDSRYDFVIERGGMFKRIQVKYVTPKDGALEVSCRSSNNWSVRAYSIDEIDIIGVYDSVSEEVYFIDAKIIGKRSIKLRLSKSKNNQLKGVRLAEDYLTIPF